MSLVFFIYSGAQQQLTRYFSELGLVEVGFQSLILIYLFLTILKPWSVWVVKTIGLKKTLLTSILAYALFIGSLAWGNLGGIYLASIMLGIAASCMATARDSYLIVSSVKNQYGASAGFFTGMTFLASASGIVVMNWMVVNWSYDMGYIIGMAVIILGIAIMLSLKDYPPDTNKVSLGFLQIIKDPKILRLSLIKFPQPFVFGLVIGTIPLEIVRLYGSNFLLSNVPLLFYLIPFITSGYFGRKSDSANRLQFLILAFALLLFAVALLLLTNWQAWFVVLSVILMATGSAILIPVSIGVIGDNAGADKVNLYTAFFGMIEASGILLAFILGRLVSGVWLNYLSILILILILYLISPLVAKKS